MMSRRWKAVKEWASGNEGNGTLLGYTADGLPTACIIEAVVTLQGMMMALLPRQRKMLMTRAVELPSQASLALSSVQVSPVYSIDHFPHDSITLHLVPTDTTACLGNVFACALRCAL